MGIIEGNTRSLDYSSYDIFVLWTLGVSTWKLENPGIAHRAQEVT